MVRQYRFGTRDLSTEAPGGIMEAGEDPARDRGPRDGGGDRFRRRRRAA
jgi:hypothetical protein